MPRPTRRDLYQRRAGASIESHRVRRKIHSYLARVANFDQMLDFYFAIARVCMSRATGACGLSKPGVTRRRGPPLLMSVVLRREILMQAKKHGVLPRVGTIVGAILAVFLLAAGPAFAGLGGSITPFSPAGPVNVGDTLTGLNVTIENASNSPNDVDYIAVPSVNLTPSCGSLGATCPGPSIDLNV